MPTMSEALYLPPIDVSIAPEQFAHPLRGVPSEVYPYRSEQGRLLWVTVKYEADEALGQTQSAILPWVWGGDTWMFSGPPDPRSLYGIESIARYGPDMRILVLGDEHDVDIARGLFRQPIVTWSRGAFAAKLSDWKPLAGREVVVWPTNTADGHAAAAELGRLLQALNCKITMIDTSGQAPGWSISRAVEQDGWDLNALKHWGMKNRREWSPPPVADSPEPIKVRAMTKAELRKKAAARPVPGSQIELWARLNLARKGNGAPYASVDNALRVLQAEQPDGSIYYDPFLNKIMVTESGIATKLRDDHLLGYQLDLQRRVGIQDMGKYATADAVALYARAHIRNSLQEWLRSIVWDKTNRVEEFLELGFGVAPTEYSRAVSRCFLLGMVARAMTPGCQVDSLPIFEGSQGIGKSRGLAALAGDFYADIDAPIGSKEFCEQIQGKWLVELSELSALRPSEVERVKSGITRVVDVYREPFAVVASDHLRQCVFAGTTNAHQYLMDDSGNRRFWPVTCGTIDRVWIAENREQIFAEALERWSNGAVWWDVPVQAAAAEADARLFVDAIETVIAEYLASHTGDVKVGDVLDAWQVPRAQWSAALQKRIGVALRAAGCRPVKSHGVMVWRRPATEAALRAARRL